MLLFRCEMHLLASLARYEDWHVVAVVAAKAAVVAVAAAIAVEELGAGTDACLLFVK